MDLQNTSAFVTGGASGLGLATARRLTAAGARVCICDFTEPEEGILAELGGAIWTRADITDEVALGSALQVAARAHGPIRAVVHCAGRGGDRMRLLDKSGAATPADSFAEVIRVNLLGTYNVMRLAAEAIAQAEDVAGERGAIVLTSSVAAFDGQIGQTAYTASKAAVHGMTLVAARDLARRLIRVNTIAPGTFATPMLGRLRADLREALEANVPNPSRLGRPEEYAQLATAMLENPYLNGETIRLDGALRMPAR